MAAGKTAQAKNAISKAKAAPRSKLRFLSAERIADSDLDSDDDSTSSDEEPLSKSNAASLAATMLGGNEATQNGKAEQKSLSASKPTSQDQDIDMDRSTSAEDSSEDGSDEATAPPKNPSNTLKKSDIAVTKVNGVKRKTTSQDESASGSSNESDEDDHKSKKTRISSGSAASSDGSEEAEQSDKEQETTAREPPSQSKKASALSSIPAQEYVAPHGYRPITPTTSSVMPASELAGKIIWHITAPVGVPLSSITSIAMDAIQSGGTVLTHGNVDYALTELAEPEASVLLPSNEGYKAISQTVKRSFALRPAFTLPTIPARASARDAGSLAAGNIATAAVTSIRPQPEVLKMRYKPPAFGSGNPGVIGVESDDVDEGASQAKKSTFQFPRTVGPSTDGDGAMMAEGSVKKKKNKQKDLVHASNGLEDYARTSTGAPAELPSTVNKVAMNVNGDAQASITEERARRKAEKKARKTAKQMSAAGAP